MYNLVPLISKLLMVQTNILETQIHKQSTKKRFKINKNQHFAGADNRLDNFGESVILNSDSTNWLFRDHKSQHLLGHRTRFSIRF